MRKSAYALIASDCESSDGIVRHAKIKAVKPAPKVLLVQMNQSVKAEIALDEYCLERDSQLHEAIIPRGCHGHEVLSLSAIALSC